MKLNKIDFFIVLFSTLLASQYIVAGDSKVAIQSNSNEILSKELVDKLYEGKSKEIQGHRVNHAKGIIISGIFIPSKKAGQISKAIHFSAPTPIIVRLSNSSSIPNIEDQNPKANPRGIAIRFNLQNQQITDLIGHSVEGFPADTPEEFINFLSMANQAANKPEQFADYIENHPASKRFFSLLDQTPQSFATTNFYPLHAFKFINKENAITVGRYIIQPVQGVDYLNEEQKKVKDKNFLFLELHNLLKNESIQYKLLLQVANSKDDLMHISQPWNGRHEVVELGLIRLSHILDNQVNTEKNLMFDPTLLISGIESVKDPMFEIRSAAYQMSKKRRSEEMLKP